MPAPMRLVAVAEILGCAVRIGVVAGREDDSGDAVDELRGCGNRRRTAEADVTRADENRGGPGVPAPGPSSGGLGVGDGDEGDDPPHPDTTVAPARNTTPKIDRVLLVNTETVGLAWGSHIVSHCRYIGSPIIT